MKLYVHQSIHINILRVGNIVNSSVLQIGSSGIIKTNAHLANTGGFTSSAPAPTHQGVVSSDIEAIHVPYQSSR